jgi:hypothetical protein
MQERSRVIVIFFGCNATTQRGQRRYNVFASLSFF